MPALSFIGAISTGHGAFPPRAASGGSPNVLVNGVGVLRVGDPYPSHCAGPSCHPGVVSAGSGTVLVNGLPAARIGDAIDCGDAVAQGSPNVFAG